MKLWSQIQDLCTNYKQNDKMYLSYIRTLCSNIKIVITNEYHMSCPSTDTSDTLYV